MMEWYKHFFQEGSYFFSKIRIVDSVSELESSGKSPTQLVVTCRFLAALILANLARLKEKENYKLTHVKIWTLKKVLTLFDHCDDDHSYELLTASLATYVAVEKTFLARAK